jgi:hypothetical protein
VGISEQAVMNAASPLPHPAAKVESTADRLQFAAIGMEAEFELWISDRLRDPRQVFGTPQRFVRQPLMHRLGSSYHLPTGGAVYFDTGVIEVATPVIEIERGCAERAGRSLWESIIFVRDELTGWERRSGRSVRLAGFSAHYNISFELDRAARHPQRTVEGLALLLTYLLPIPVMLIAANRRSSGVGVRPRGNRIEVTVDFTPSPALTIATGALITGIARQVMTWPSFDLRVLAERKLPVVAGFTPIEHTSRKGWLAHASCFPVDPFSSDIDAPIWRTTDGRTQSLREIGGRMTRTFWRQIRAVSEPFTAGLIGSLMRGRAPSLLELADRPPEYDDVGRLCRWDDLFPDWMVSRSRYERVLIHAIRGERLRIDGDWYRPIGMRGWAQVVFRRIRDGMERSCPIDALLHHLDDWDGNVRDR